MQQFDGRLPLGKVHQGSIQIARHAAYRMGLEVYFHRNPRAQRYCVFLRDGREPTKQERRQFYLFRQQAIKVIINA